MPSRSNNLWLIGGSAATVALSAWFAAAWFAGAPLQAWSRARLARQHEERIAALPEKAATRWLAQLASEDGAWLEPVAAAWSDSRPAVAAAAELEAYRLVERWSQLPAAESAPQVARLANLLAQQAPQMSSHQREAAAVLAQRLIDWPLADSPVDAACFIADCDALLQLEPALPPQLRIAALPPSEPLPPVQPPAAIQPADPLPSITAPPVLQPVPAPIAAGSPAPPPEPQKLPAPKAKAIKISDD
jgi:hypothetical protein